MSGRTTNEFVVTNTLGEEIFAKTFSTNLERAWADVLTTVHRPDAIPALIAVLDHRGTLDELKQTVLAEAAAELRADVEHKRTNGKLGEAVALIEAGAARDDVIAAGISRRTFFRAQRQCQSAKPRRPDRHAS